MIKEKTNNRSNIYKIFLLDITITAMQFNDISWGKLHRKQSDPGYNVIVNQLIAH